jgi:hypothetical protein
MRIINNKIVTEKTNRYKPTRLSYYGKQKSYIGREKNKNKNSKAVVNINWKNNYINLRKQNRGYYLFKLKIKSIVISQQLFSKPHQN